MKRSILLVGAGQLGSRHLQALALLEISCEIFVIDPFQASLDLAKKRFEEVLGFEKHRLNYISSINELEKSRFDIAIISTNSNTRSYVIKDLLCKTKIDYFILEKVLFQTIKEYEDINNLFEEKNSKAFVNTPGRTYKLYQELKSSLTTNEPIQMEIIGSNWGLGCNSIHFIDLFNFLTDEIIQDWNNNLDSNLINSKRDGFKEFFGNLNYQTQNGHRLNLTCFLNDNPVNYSIRISTPNKRIIVEPLLGKAYEAKFETNWAIKEISTNFPYQSQLTHKVVNSLFETGTCDLTPYNLSIYLHIPFISTILNHYNKLQNNTTEVCPIT